MGSVVWGGRTFSSKAQLASWLSARGANYATWARNHPAAAASLEGRSYSGAPGGTPVPGVQAPPSGNPGDYAQLLQNEGIYVPDQAQLQAQSDAEKAQMDAAIKALQFQYNDPSNPYSFIAGLNKWREGARGNLTADRAARGVLASGGTKLGQEDIGHQYGQQQYEEQNRINQQIGQLQSQFAQDQYQRMLQQQQFLADAQQRLIDAGIGPQAAAAGGAAPTGGGRSYASLLQQYGQPGQYVPGSGPGMYSTFGSTKAPASFTAAVNALGRTATPTVDKTGQSIFGVHFSPAELRKYGVLGPNGSYNSGNEYDAYLKKKYGYNVSTGQYAGKPHQNPYSFTQNPTQNQIAINNIAPARRSGAAGLPASYFR